MINKYLVVILGPTAVGKTSLSIEIAKELKTEIISADSRQVFKEIRIGTAKLSKEEMQGISHHFINSHSIKEDFNAGKFEQEAIPLIERLFQSKNILVMAGGSGLYIDAVCNGFDHLPVADENVRKELNELFLNKGISELQNILKQKDTEYYAKVDLNNPHRLIRAIEVCLVSEKPYSSFRKAEKVKRNFKTIKIGINTNREKLYERINQRVDEMMQKGFLDEVKKVYPYRHFNSLKTVGYNELFDYLDGKLDLEKAIDLIKQNTRRFAKRQLTWFKKDKEINWFEPEEKEKILKFVKENTEQ